MAPRPRVIGWKEWVALPEWGVDFLLAKSDTGARRSALDVADIVELADGRIAFTVVMDRRKPGLQRRLQAEVAHRTHVRSSNGQQHERYFVVTTLRLAGVEKPIELSLVCRKAMACRMLLGRAALADDFLIDPRRTFLAGRKGGSGHRKHPTPS